MFIMCQGRKPNFADETVQNRIAGSRIHHKRVLDQIGRLRNGGRGGVIHAGFFSGRGIRFLRGFERLEVERHFLTEQKFKEINQLLRVLYQFQK